MRGQAIIKPSRFLAAAAGLILATILLGFAVVAGWTGEADSRLGLALGLQVGESSPAFIAFMQGVSWIGGGVPRWIIVVLLAALVWRWCGPRCAVALAGASLLSNLVSSLIKLAFGRARPELVDHLDHVSSAAYPSGHATSAAVVYLLLAGLAPPRWRVAAWLLAATMIVLNGLSRVMLGVHWPSDVVGGTLLGAAFALLGAWWVRRSSKPVAPGDFSLS